MVSRRFKFFPIWVIVPVLKVEALVFLLRTSIWSATRISSVVSVTQSLHVVGMNFEGCFERVVNDLDEASGSVPPIVIRLLYLRRYFNINSYGFLHQQYVVAHVQQKIPAVNFCLRVGNCSSTYWATLCDFSLL